MYVITQFLKRVAENVKMYVAILSMVPVSVPEGTLIPVAFPHMVAQPLIAKAGEVMVDVGRESEGCCKSPVPAEDLSARGPAVHRRPWTKLQKGPLSFLASTSTRQYSAFPGGPWTHPREALGRSGNHT